MLPGLMLPRISLWPSCVTLKCQISSTITWILHTNRGRETFQAKESAGCLPECVLSGLAQKDSRRAYHFSPGESLVIDHREVTVPLDPRAGGPSLQHFSQFWCKPSMKVSLVQIVFYSQRHALQRVCGAQPHSKVILNNSAFKNTSVSPNLKMK